MCELNTYLYVLAGVVLVGLVYCIQWLVRDYLKLRNHIRYYGSLSDRIDRTNKNLDKVEKALGVDNGFFGLAYYSDKEYALPRIDAIEKKLNSDKKGKK